MSPATLLDFWFGTAREDPAALPERQRFWFGGAAETAAESAARDDLLRGLFGSTAELAARGGLDHWQADPPGRLALILLLDQLPRNLYRGSRRAFASDDAARALTLDGLDLGHDGRLTPIERVFFYMPLEHSERVADQDRCVGLFEVLEARAPAGLEATYAGFTRYARLHRDIVARFGRFPHRNRVLGRMDTAEEADYLAGDAPAFGQA